MQKYLKATLLLLGALLIATLARVPLPESKEQKGQTQSAEYKNSNEHIDRKPKHKDSRWPLVDYNAPDSADPEEREKRKAKNKRHDKQDFIGKPTSVIDSGEVNLINDWEVGFPALPTEHSTAILIGEIKDAHAYLSEDKTGIYSEFSFHVETVLKNGSSTQIGAGNTVFVERIGGRVRLPPGHVWQYGIDKQGMPVVGGRYLLFLSGNGVDNFNILTGYELREAKVFPLDGVDPADGSKLPQFAEYEGADETTFLRTVVNSISKPLQPN